MNDAALQDVIASQFIQGAPRKLGVAVSGGGDSMALLVLLSRLTKAHGFELAAISVDHCLRAEAKDEIALVSALCKTLGVTHSIVSWSGWDGVGNLQGRAREARYEMIASWAKDQGISMVALGHTATDQAETVLMRLARGAGVDGLSAMSVRRIEAGVTWIRPLLSEDRETLRNFLRRNKIVWADDPSNENRDFERIRMRDVLSELACVGVTVEHLASVALNMSDAKSALEHYTIQAAHDVCSIKHGAVKFDLLTFQALPKDIARRLLLRAIKWINSATYPPRRAAVEQLQRSINKGVSATLDGCQVTCKPTCFTLFREPNAVINTSCSLDEVWDARWSVCGLSVKGQFRVAALGEVGIQAVPTWRDLGMPRGAVLSLPAVWDGDELLALPALGDQQEWQAKLEQDEDTFFATLLSH